MTRALRGVRLDAIDNRSQVGVALRHIREELTTQLGGEVTPAQRILIDEAARTAVIARATGEWIVAQATLMRSDLSLVPVVLQREGIVANLLRLLQAIGLRREQKPVETLASFIAARSKG